MSLGDPVSFGFCSSFVRNRYVCHHIRVRTNNESSKVTTELKSFYVRVIGMKAHQKHEDSARRVDVMDAGRWVKITVQCKEHYISHTDPNTCISSLRYSFPCLLVFGQRVL